MRMDRLNSVCAEVNVNIFSPTSPAAGRLERLLAPHFRRMYPGQSLQYGRIGITRFPLPFRAIQQDNALDRTVIKVHAHLTAQRPVEFSAWRIGLTIEINALRIVESVADVEKSMSATAVKTNNGITSLQLGKPKKWGTVTFKPKTVRELKLASEKNTNRQCPICRYSHSGLKDAWHEKVQKDKATNRMHKVSMQNATGECLFSGAKQGHFND